MTNPDVTDDTRTEIQHFVFEITPNVSIGLVNEWHIRIKVNDKGYSYVNLFPRIPSHLSEADVYFQAAADAYRRACNGEDPMP